MSELRYDPFKRTWVIIASERGQRPRDNQFPKPDTVQGKMASGGPACPFCPGNEAMTPPEILAIREPDTGPDTPGWRVRVIPNKYPALTTESPFNPEGLGPHLIGAGFGTHEIIIETPEDNLQIEDLPREHLADVLKIYVERLNELNSDGRFRTVLLFKNRGAEAGATIGHSHSQIMAIPVVPRFITDELSSCREHFNESGRCMMCRIIEEETQERVRVVVEDERYLVFAPFSSSVPFELRIVPREHCQDFSRVEDADLTHLSEVMKQTLKRLNTALDDPPYNFILHTSPPPPVKKGDEPSGPVEEYYHWYFELTPRTTRSAGFERGTGFFINPTAPEEAAETLRNVVI
jgi:UDPglucose--hexose-1-phosphate uridylyltransferase